MIEPLKHLGTIPVNTFMQEYWQIKPCLIRQAFPSLEPLCDLDTIKEMASDPDIESRLIIREADSWSLTHGPVDRLPSLKKKGWTILLQGLDHHLPEAYDLLQQFRFIPDARLDDIMLSLASDQGGVGAHYDSYDVFLLQMTGKRRWKIGPLTSRDCIEGAPLKLLADFAPTEEFLLEPGDMLYLPPNYGHDGVAEGTCATISIGFRAPSHAELLAGVLRGLADEIDCNIALQNQLFSDPGRGATQFPGELPRDLVGIAAQLFTNLSPPSEAIVKSLGTLLTEPKPTVYFENNTEDMNTTEIADAFRSRGIALSMKTKMIYADEQFFINGECIKPKFKDCIRYLQLLANKRDISADQASEMLELEEFKFFLIGFAKAGWVETLS